MKFLSRVVWSEGMHLGPHHFQTQSRYFEDSLWFVGANLRQYPWGFLNCSLDQEAVLNGQAILSYASGIFPDGLIFDIPDCDSMPVPAVLNQLFTPTDSEITLFLAVPARNDQGSDCDLTGGLETRFSAVHRSVRDDAVGQDDHDVSFARKNLSLVGEAQLAPGMVAFPIAKVRRDGKGGYICVPDFIPPCLRIGTSEHLMLLLGRLIETIDDRIASVRNDRQSSGRMELGTSALDVANYWFLHCLCSNVPSLRHHLANRMSHPEDVYRDLARLAGALSTFSIESSAEEVPKYLHQDLTSTFTTLNGLIRRYLEVVVPSNSITLEFKKSDRMYIYTAEVNDERCVRRVRWIFGIRSAIGESALLRLVPGLVKVCSGRGVKKLVDVALPGLQMMHLPVPPSALAAQADMHYFSISLDGICWQDIQTTRQVGLYIPAEIGDATFNLTVITETKS
jgi:type VI secretion system protein ImpJ